MNSWTHVEVKVLARLRARATRPHHHVSYAGHSGACIRMSRHAHHTCAGANHRPTRLGLSHTSGHHAPLRRFLPRGWVRLPEDRPTVISRHFCPIPRAESNARVDRCLNPRSMQPQAQQPRARRLLRRTETLALIASVPLFVLIPQFVVGNAAAPPLWSVLLKLSRRQLL